MSGLPLTPGKRAGNLVFVSGQLGFGADRKLVDDTVEGQTKQAMKNIEAVLTDHGVGLSDVVKVSVWLTDKGDFPGFNEAYASFFEPGQFPTRATVISGLVVDGAKVEIDAVALIPDS
jgi:2-iminobutanoate/2-iminopropanoate deaminase